MKRSLKAAVPSSRADRTVRSAQGCSVRCFPVEAGGRDRRIRLGRSPAGGLLLFRFSRNTRRISVFENWDRDRLRFRTLFPSFSLRSRFGSRYDTHPPTEPIKRGSERTGDDPEPVEPRPTRTDSFVPAGVRPTASPPSSSRGDRRTRLKRPSNRTFGTGGVFMRSGSVAAAPHRRIFPRIPAVHRTSRSFVLSERFETCGKPGKRAPRTGCDLRSVRRHP